MCRNGSHTVKSPMQSPNGSASNALPHSASSTRKPQHANPDTSLSESHYQRARQVILSYVDEENKIVSPQICDITACGQWSPRRNFGGDGGRTPEVSALIAVDMQGFIVKRTGFIEIRDLRFKVSRG